MSEPARRYHVVADRAGRILALLPARATRVGGGVELGWRPVAGARQVVAEIDLTDEHTGLSPQEMIEAFALHVDRKTGRARLKRRGPVGRRNVGGRRRR